VDREAAARYGLNVADIQDVIEMVLAARPQLSSWEGERHFAVTVRLRCWQHREPALDHSEHAFGGMYVPLRSWRSSPP
jgi:cobalt-zinc-cadmium resistance protein CzcA